jgi:hypothetical protein
MTRRFTSSPTAFLIAASLFGGTAVAGTLYRAEPAAPPAAGRLIIKDVVWKCGTGGCVAPQHHSRPAVDCLALVRKIGALRSFTVGGQPLDAAALGKCNARAR